MAGYDYREIVSPGDAFSQDFNEFMFKQAALKRQALLDEVAAKRETRLEEADRLDNQLRRAQLDERVQEAKDREATNFVKRYQASHVAGDIPDAGTLTKAKELGVEDMFREDTSKAVAPPPSQSMELPGAVPIPGQTAPPPAVRLAPSQSEAGLKGPQTYPGSVKEQELATQHAAAKQLLDSLPEGPEKEAVKFWLATGKEPPAGYFTSKTAKQPELGTFGDYLYTLSNGHPESLTAAQKEAARKKWGEEGRAPQSPINLFTLGADGQLVPAGQMPHGGRLVTPHRAAVTQAQIDKLSPAQQVVFKDVLKRRSAEEQGILPAWLGGQIPEDKMAEIYQEAMDAAEKVKPGAAAPGQEGMNPAVSAILKKLQERP